MIHDSNKILETLLYSALYESTYPNNDALLTETALKQAAFSLHPFHLRYLFNQILSELLLFVLFWRHFCNGLIISWFLAYEIWTFALLLQDAYCVLEGS